MSQVNCLMCAAVGLTGVLQPSTASFAYICPNCGTKYDARTLRPIHVAGQDRPLYTSYLVGWRDWEVASDGHHLCSRTRQVYWPIKQPLRSKCGHLLGPPSMECQECGIHAHKEREDLLQIQPRPVVHGKVALWGVVVEWTKGYQAEYAYPLELYTTQAILVDRLNAYGVPVIHQEPAPIKKRTGMFTLKTGVVIRVEIIRKAGMVFGRYMLWIRTPTGQELKVAADRVKPD